MNARLVVPLPRTAQQRGVSSSGIVPDGDSWVGGSLIGLAVLGFVRLI